jgi:4-amino-4-deoxy-L-arabinose transferase-like glycosyltransferase
MSATKPPFAGWLAAGFHFLFGGWWEGAWRAPSLLSAGVLVYLLWRAGSRLLPEWGGLVAVSAFSLNIITPRLATLVRTDMMMAAWTCGMGLLILHKVRTQQPWTTRDRWVLFALALGSVFTKGPISYVMVLPGVAWMMWWKRKNASAGFAWTGWWPWVLPLVPLAGWAVAGCLLDQQFYEQVILKEFLGRVTGEHQGRPVYYYLPHLVQKFAPWSLLLVALACVREVRESIRKDPSLMWLVAWALGGLIVFSLIPSKRADRMFPIIPPLCLLLPGMLSALPHGRLFRWNARRAVLACIAFAAVMSGGYAAYRVAENVRNDEGSLAEFGRSAKETSAANGWKLGVTEGLDEGLALYTRQSHLLSRTEAQRLWLDGSLDALILPVGEAKRLREGGGRYRVVARSKKTSASREMHVFIAREEKAGGPGGTVSPDGSSR